MTSDVDLAGGTAEQLQFVPAVMMKASLVGYAELAVKALDVEYFYPGKRVFLSGVHHLQDHPEWMWTGRSDPTSTVIEISCEEGARAELGFDFGVDVAATVLSLSTLEAFHVGVFVPACLTSFTPMQALFDITPNSLDNARPLKNVIPDFRVVAENRLPTVQEVLQRGAIAIVFRETEHHVSGSSDAEKTLAHQLLTRWGIGSCSCC